nr:MAG TPA: hypothetical protein [Caudoviricetes sp.]
MKLKNNLLSIVNLQKERLSGRFFYLYPDGYA